MKYFLFIFLSVNVHLDAQSSIRTGQDFAYFFYVENFEDKGWPPLPETKSEAELIAAELQFNYGFQVEIFPNFTKKEIESTIATINNRRYKPDDQVLFFFSTHGYYDPLQNEGFIIPKDGRIEDRYGDTWISYANLGRRITINGSEHVLLALDACYSGAFGIHNKNHPDGDSLDDSLFGDDCHIIIRKALESNSRLYFSSGSKEQRTPAQSLFAQRWLEVLRHGNELGIVKSKHLRRYLNRIEHPRPEYGTFANHKEDGDFVFVHKNACKIMHGAQQDDQHWQLFLKDSSKIQLLEHLKKFPGCSHYNDALKLLAIIKDVPNETSASIEEDSEINKAAKTPDEFPGFVFVQGGTFQMGSEDGRDNEFPKHHVRVEDFYISSYEVTVGEYLEFTNDSKSNFPRWMRPGDASHYQTGTKDDFKKLGAALTNEKHPIVGVSWEDAISYCNWRSKKEGLKEAYTIGYQVEINWNANGYRLPTEAEWEFAARSRGKDEKWSGTGSEEDLYLYANFWENAKPKSDTYQYTSPIGSFKPNDLGIFDMSGNVWEWCWGREYTYPATSQKHLRGPDPGPGPIHRGGSYASMPETLRCTIRASYSRRFANNTLGFRLARSAP